MNPTQTPIKYAANLTTQGISVGGWLHATPAGVRFEANAANKFFSKFGANPTDVTVDLPVAIIKSITIQSPTYNWIDGGLRKRLRIDTADGRIYLFVINKLQSRVQELHSTLALQDTSLVPATPFLDPTKDKANSSAIAKSFGAPDKSAFRKILIGLAAAPFIGGLLSLVLPTGTNTLLGVFLPILFLVGLYFYLAIKGSYAMLRKSYQTITAEKPPATTVFDSTSKGVNLANMSMYKLSLQIKIIALLIPYLFYSVIIAAFFA